VLIHFDSLPCRYGMDSALHVVVSNHGGLRLQASVMFRQNDRRRRDMLPTSSAIDVVWSNGSIRSSIATHPTPFRVATGGARGAQHHESWSLPWPSEPLADTTLAIRIDDTTYTLGLPYGLCRDESQPVPAPLEASLPIATSRRWTNVGYESEPHGPWRISLEVEDPGRLEVVLYRETDNSQPLDVTVALDGRPARQVSDWRRVEMFQWVATFEAFAVDPRRHYARCELASVHGTRVLTMPSSLLWQL
jgi:hypothetical protein